MPRILVVDDEEELVEHTLALLRRRGWEAVPAYNGVEAVLRVMEGGFAAVLLDIHMPQLDGLSALKLIRKYDARLPVVMFTGQAGVGDMMNAVRLGAYACLLKPAEGPLVIQALEEAVAAANLSENREN